MENHATRKEFAAALAGSVGIDERNSHTVGIPFIYVAAPISGGAVRLAYPLPEIEITDRPARQSAAARIADRFLDLPWLSLLSPRNMSDAA